MGRKGIEWKTVKVLFKRVETFVRISTRVAPWKRRSEEPPLNWGTLCPPWAGLNAREELVNRNFPHECAADRNNHRLQSSIL